MTKGSYQEALRAGSGSWGLGVRALRPSVRPAVGAGDPRPTGAPGLLTPFVRPSVVVQYLPVRLFPSAQSMASEETAAPAALAALGVRPSRISSRSRRQKLPLSTEKSKRVCYTPRMRDVNQNSIRFIRCIWKSTRGPAGADASSDGSSTH